MALDVEMKALAVNTDGSSDNVLVYGDWYVDAHWVVAPHESETASRPGEMQSLAVHDLEATVRALCGAGQVASILHAGQKHDCPYGRVYGLGSWAKGDDEFIQAFMHGNHSGDNPLRLRSRIQVEELASENRHVFNLSESDTTTGTNRVIRIYRKSSASDYRLVERIDFETLRMGELKLPQLSVPIGCILVKDHAHGVVRPEIVNALKKQYPEAAWYVCTKRWPTFPVSGHRGVDWLDTLRGERLRLLLFQHEAASRATTFDSLSPEVGNWFVETQVPTRNAIRAIDRVAEYIGATADSTAIVALPSRESLIARIPKSLDGVVSGFSYRGPSEQQHEKFVPRASALFAAIFCSDRAGDTPNWTEKLKRALTFTAIWVQEEAKRLTDRKWQQNPVVLSAKGEGMVDWQKSAAASNERIRQAAPKRQVEFDWEYVKEEYRQAFTGPPHGSYLGYGLITRNEEHHLELWRAKSDVPGIVSIVRSKRQLLRQLASEFDDFIRTAGRRHRSFLIVDDPGGGKSTLVRTLAAAKGMRVLPVNITELTRRVDLLAFFDTIVTTQAQDPTMPIVVFVDEINALLEGHTVYSSFLAPLEDGHYNRDGKSFIIRPCIWIFVGTDEIGVGAHLGERDTLRSLQQLRRKIDLAAGATTITEDLSQLHDDRTTRDRSQKTSDFFSRLSLPPFLLNHPFPQSGKRRAQVYAKFALHLKQVSNANLLVKVADAMADGSATSGPDEIALRLIGNQLLRRGRALERVYVGAEMITTLHPDVERISLRVLKAFAALPDDFTYRDLRHDLERMVNVQRGVVLWRNLPVRFHDYFGVKWLETDLRDLDDGNPREPQTLSEACKDQDDEILVSVQRMLPDGDIRWTGLQESKTAQPQRTAPTTAAHV